MFTFVGSLLLPFMKDYYRILQITPDASQEEIKRAYRKLAKVYHPDVVGGSREQVFIHEINEAYRTLGNTDRRSKYDWIRTNRSAAEAEVAARESKRTQSYRTATPEPVSERALVKPYLKYAYTISNFSLAFCLLLAIDFLLPPRKHVDKATYVLEVFSPNNGRQFYDHTKVQTWKGHSLAVSKEAGLIFSEDPNIHIYTTPLFAKARYVASAGKAKFRYLINRSVYGNFIFLPALLLLCAFLGSIKRFPATVDFSFGVVSGILLLICGGLLLVQ